MAARGQGSAERVEKTLRGKVFLLSPLRGEQAMDWVSATVEDGRCLARAMGAIDITDEIVMGLITRGVERCAQALGCELEFAAQLTESERSEVIAEQDRLQEAHLIEPFLNIQQIAARAYLGR